MKTVNKNFIYNIIYQLFIFIIPLITTPYISRVLGADNIGIYAYTYSIVYYFMLVSMLGINNHASRTLAKLHEDRDKLSKKFWSIYLLQLSISIITLITYFIFLKITNSEYKKIMFIQSIYLVSTCFDINWLFFALENFKITISRNIIIKIISMIMVFTFVKRREDLWIYTLIMSCGTLLSQIYLWFYLKKYIDFKHIKFKDILINLKPCLILFIPVIAYSIYRVMDKTMIGILSNTFELGNYESAEKIISIPLTLVTALGTVMLPNASKSKESEIKEKIMDSFKLCFCFIVPIIFGLLCISKDFSLLFFGKEFSKTYMIIIILLPSVLFSAIATIIRTNYLIPEKQDKIYICSTILGALVNLVFNFIFIKKYGAYGACIGTIIAEFTVMLYQIIKTKNVINYKNVLKLLGESTYKSFIMYIIIFVLGLKIKNLLIKIIVQVLIGVIIYFVMNKDYIQYEFLGMKRGKKIDKIKKN